MGRAGCRACFSSPGSILTFLEFQFPTAAGLLKEKRMRCISRLQISTLRCSCPHQAVLSASLHWHVDIFHAHPRRHLPSSTDEPHTGFSNTNTERGDVGNQSGVAGSVIEARHLTACPRMTPRVETAWTRWLGENVCRHGVVRWYGKDASYIERDADPGKHTNSINEEVLSNIHKLFVTGCMPGKIPSASCYTNALK